MRFLQNLSEKVFFKEMLLSSDDLRVVNTSFVKG